MRRILFFLGLTFLTIVQNGIVYAQSVWMADTTIVTCSSDYFDSGGPIPSYSSNEKFNIGFSICKQLYFGGKLQQL
ncbi:MAG: hypothetical protein IPF81_19140 [Bacteroidetes bacterium]|nr:hypothetical protein [Bacteroidota bacterium]